MPRRLFLFPAMALAAYLPVLACSGDDSTVAPIPDASPTGTPDATSLPEAASSNDAGPMKDGSPAPGVVTFSYRPAWSGVTSVAVVGGFGQATDWMAATPFLTLTSDGSGGFTGKAPLPVGMYAYVFLVKGDADTATPSTFQRFVIDPDNPAYTPCPAQSPTFDKNAPNPCSQLTMPQPAAATLYHLKGTVTYDGAARAGYIVVLEREEKSSHHFMANRSDSAADGSFDFAMAQGTYRIQVQHPTLLSETDLQRDPLTLQAMRRQISSQVLIAAPSTFAPVDVAYHDYAKLSPVGDAGAPPVTFSYTVIAASLAARLAVYGPGKNVGDPWYASAYSAATSAVFDGGFNTPQALEDAAAPDASYWWGTWQLSGPTDGGVKWAGESMVFPVTFQ